MSSNRRQNCDDCLHIDRPIIIVGPRRFSAEILANYICANTPAKWQIVEQLPEITASCNQDDWRLIFIDCLGLSTADITSLLKKDASRFLASDVVALLNMRSEEPDFLQLINLGIRGFFFDRDSPALILKGICALKNGELWIPRTTLLEYVSQQQRKTSSEIHPDILLLTRREREVLRLLSSGLSNDEIAGQLFVSNHTVKSHIYKILKKLNVENRLQAALWAAQHLQ